MEPSHPRALAPSHLSRLYAILDVELTEARGLAPLDLLDIWLGAGVRLVQLRAKTLASGPLLDLAAAMAGRARLADAAFIVNDRAEIARMAGAAGVHLGQDDLSPSDARVLMGAGAIIGRSTHSSGELAAALDEPIDYAAVGAVFTTRMKPASHPTVGLGLVRAAAALAGARGLPLVAIGGIQVDTAASVIEAGASAVAVISDLLDGDPAERVRSYLRVLR